jgi:uncharacterized iron-regulated membrane protein
MSESPTPAVESALYRRVWRWHFYAGLVCLPFLALMAITGALYLFKEPIESLLYERLHAVEARTTTALDAQALVARALAAAPGQALRFVAPEAPGRSAEVGIRTEEGIVAVYLDAADGRVLGTLHDDARLMNIVKRIHSLAIAGPVGNHWIEVVAGWAIVLVASGVFLWWPRGRKGGVLSVRARPAQRLWWRDVHAVTGIVAAAAIVFLAATGMPWSAFWGEQFGRLATAWGVGVPQYLWGPTPQSDAPRLGGLQAVPWTALQTPLPQSGSRASHHDEQPASAAAAVGDLGLNEALRVFAQEGVPIGTPVRLPDGPRGVYTAMRFPDDVRDVRVVHLDRYSGAVLADIGYAQYGVVGRVTEWGISLHTGRQFGWANLLVMLAGCLAIVALALSAAVMWWKRRPPGHVAAPPRRAGDRAATGAIAVAALLSLIYPLLGASMLVALMVDVLVPAGWRRRFGL